MTFTPMNRRTILKSLAIGTAGLIGADMLGPKAAFAIEGKTLKIRNDGDIRNIDPAMRSGWYDETIMFAIFSSLIQYKAGKEWEYELDAAESFDASDPMAIKFSLKPGMKWTNGHGDVTAEDVKYSFERFKDEKLDAIYGSDWAALDHVEVTDELSGIIHMTKPFAPLLASTLPRASGIIVCKKALEENGGKIETDPFATSGPYTFADWQPRQRITLKRNPDFVGPQPYFEEIQLFPIQDKIAAETAFDAGDLDCTQIQISSIADRKGGKATLTVRPALAYTWLGMNVENPKLSDVKVRRAIQRAVNVPEVVSATFGDAIEPAHGLVPPPLLGARDKVLYPFDQAEAKKLLAEAGAEGLSLTCVLGMDSDQLIAAQVIQAQLAAVGINLKVRQMDDATMDAQMQDKNGGWKTSEVWIDTFTTAPDPSWVTEWFTCGQVGEWNFQRTCDESWDAENAKAVEETDETKRAKMYRDLQDKLEETGAYVPLYHGVNAWISAPELTPAFTPDGQWPVLREMAVKS
ncbi:ABC transporter substrate-binding protein [Jiella mangrovi]|uniref:Solute-binding protein family 5 domain-containing protein n=1 Tax=Jiella mangrovi TaxID=2821407 RepID=A0ABS4BIQ3_9HYPH|nr:ABC transporter substrate-binding protein [Jiella mangrovi]MBP0615904.1 hypothetical protein [Jiella mangrovi]